VLREELLEVQSTLRNADFPVIIVVGGVDGAGKGETINTLLEWLDPRFVETFAVAPPTDEERERPRYWRFWRALPPRGKIASSSVAGIRHRSSIARIGRSSRPSSIASSPRSSGSRTCSRRTARCC